MAVDRRAVLSLAFFVSAWVAYVPAVRAQVPLGYNYRCNVELVQIPVTIFDDKALWPPALRRVTFGCSMTELNKTYFTLNESVLRFHS